jgi:ankyrin repeat protein
MNALHHAATAGSSAAIQVLAEAGADLDEPSMAVSQGHGYPRDVGATALGLAAQAGDLDAVETLLALGADVDAPSTAGHTPLLLAVFAGRSPEVVAALLAAGADRTVRATCERGCSVAGGDALEWARELDRTDLVPLLESATG